MTRVRSIAVALSLALGAVPLASLLAPVAVQAADQPPATDFGRTLGDRAKTEWKDIGNGVRFWQFPKEDR